MTKRRTSRLSLEALLATVEDAPPVDAVDAVGEHLAAALGAREVSFLIADFSGQALIRLGHADRGAATRRQGRETAERVPLAGTAHGRALAGQDPQLLPEDGASRVLAPVTSRGEAIGVLELLLDEVADEETVGDIAQAAHALAYVVIANRRFTDLFEWGQRSVPLSLAAEIQHRLLPGSYTCEAGQFTLAGWLEPAGDVGGDTFDFALERDTLHLSVTDAMGHTVKAAVLATVVVGALRNARRRGVELAEQAQLANRALIEHAGEASQLVTGQLARVDLPTGTVRIVNAGHPRPRRLREGRVEEIQLMPDVPLGVAGGTSYLVQPLELRAGDRVVFLTDGMFERNAAGVDLDAALLETRDMHPREAVQHLTRAVLDACGGELRDDAMALCFDWQGGPPRGRDARWGASR